MNNTPTNKNKGSDLSLVLGGPLYQFYLRFRLAEPHLELIHRRIFVLLLITWLPLLVFTIISGKAFGGVKVPFLLDIGTHARLLLAAPLLLVGELFVHKRLTSRIRRFLDLGLIAHDDVPRFESAKESCLRLRNSPMIEIGLVLVAFAIGYWSWNKYVTLNVDTWYSVTNDNLQLTKAGYWYTFVSLPIFRFLLVRWYFRILIWYIFLWKVSRIPLRLSALHPDLTGGLGFLGKSASDFSPVLLAHTVLLSGFIASQIFYEHASMLQFKLEMAGILVILLLLVLVPLTFFTTQLLRAKRIETGEYSLLSMEYVNQFRQRWLAPSVKPKEPLGSADIQSLADLAEGFGLIGKTRIFPFGKKTVISLVVTILLPLLPLTLTIIPFSEMIEKLLKVLP